MVNLNFHGGDIGQKWSDLASLAREETSVPQLLVNLYMLPHEQQKSQI
jgi:hypothetical protein